MQNYFKEFRDKTVGNEVVFHTPYGEIPLIYADWIASGRLYHPIEERLLNTFGPFVGNTHTETSETGTLMTKAYHLSQKLIKQHVNAGPDDVILTTGFGMTGVIVKFQRILGLKSCGKLLGSTCIHDNEKPVVFITHMEHHSNQTSWYETYSDVVVLTPDDDLQVNPEELRAQLEIYKDRKIKIGAFTACSNVTGISTPIHQLARIMHEYDGVCFVDYAASAPYTTMNMHPTDPMEKLDAIYFSPHKFLGGPGASGVLIFDRKMYKIDSPDQPGGGTVEWTNPWGEYKFIDDIEVREDGGTPGFLQAFKTALAIEVKNKMGVDNIHKRELELTDLAMRELDGVPGLHILAENIQDRLGIISFFMDGIHFNLVVKLLSDRYGVQVRGGCACAGTYGHYLLNVTHEKSNKITTRINYGDLSKKPGWIRLSLHPTMTDTELETVIRGLHEIRAKGRSWIQDYNYDKHTNEFRHISEYGARDEIVKSWFKF